MGPFSMFNFFRQVINKDNNLAEIEIINATF